MTPRLVSLIVSVLQISFVDSSSISRNMNTLAIRSGSLPRQRRMVVQNSELWVTTSGSGFQSLGPFAWTHQPSETNLSENSSDKDSISVKDVSRPSLR